MPKKVATRKRSTPRASTKRSTTTKKSTTKKPNTTKNPRKGSLEEDLHNISNPTPRSAPSTDKTDLEKMLNIKWSRFIPHTPTNKQLAALMLQDTKEVLYGGALGGGKFVGINDSILTPNGFVKNRDIFVGDIISDPSGGTSVVTQWKGWEELQCYKVSFHDGTYLEVPLAHRWLAWRSGRTRKEQGRRLHGKDSAKVVSTSTLIKWHKKVGECKGQNPWILIPTTEPVEFANNWNRDIDPYLFGAILGDGCLTQNRVTLTCSSEDFEHWNKYLSSYSTSVDTKYDGNKTIRVIKDSRRLIRQSMKENLEKTAEHKHIPKELLLTKINSRVSLLQGLIDTDGYIDERGQVYYCSISPQLRADVSWLVRSLGGVCTEFDENELYIKLPDSVVPCRLPRKLERVKPRIATLYKKVVNIEKTTVKKGRCISVSQKDGLYITNNFTVTHNSDFLAYEALRFCDIPDFTSIIFRKQLTDLKQPKSLIPRVAQWLEPFRAAGQCTYKADDHCWHFKTTYPGTDIPGPPAMLQWGYIGDAAIRERYQSAEYQLVCFDELGQWNSPVDYQFMNSRIRATVCPIHGKDDDNNPKWDDKCHICNAKRQIKLRLRAAMNPGPAWVKRRFQIVPDPKQFKTRQAALIAIQEGEKINWVGTHPYRRFIPAYLSDNPHLSEKDYREMLKEMTEDERSRLEDGNWESRKNARFKRKWIYGQYINVYSHGYSFLDEDMNESIILPFSSLKQIFVTVDSAATAKLYTSKDDEEAAMADGRSAQKPSSTCIGIWGVTHEDKLLWLDFHKFRKELPDIVETLVSVYNLWAPSFIKIEANGLGIGVAQFAALAGLPVRKNNRKKDKLENSLSAQMMMKHGQIYFAANTPWAETAEDDIFNWTGLPDEEDDTVDVLADAALEITPRMAGKVTLPKRKPSLPGGVSTAKQNTMGIPQYGLPISTNRYPHH